MVPFRAVGGEEPGREWGRWKRRAPAVVGRERVLEGRSRAGCGRIRRRAPPAEDGGEYLHLLQSLAPKKNIRHGVVNLEREDKNEVSHRVEGMIKYCRKT